MESVAGPYLAQMRQPLSSFPGAETQNTKKIDCPKTFKLDGSVHAHFNKNLELNAKATCEL